MHLQLYLVLVGEVIACANGYDIITQLSRNR